MNLKIWILVWLGVSMQQSLIAQTNWIDVTKSDQIQVYGLAWYQQNDRKFLRLPLAEKGKVPPLAWSVSTAPSGARVRFKTDSTSLKLRISHGLTSSEYLSMWHMSAAAVSGIDLYIGPPEDMHYWNTTNPKSADTEYEHVFFENMPRIQREITLYLPTYASLVSLQIGIDDDALLQRTAPYKITKPIVFYGTSITQGACAGRAGNGFVARINRMLNCDVVNLGFSGSGCGEPLMAELISQIDASAYVIDSVANMDTALMKERYESFVQILRNNKPQVPLVLMTKIHFSNEIEEEYAREYEQQHRPLFQTYNKLTQAGDQDIFLFDAGSIIPPGGDHPTVDGIHLLDEGYGEIAGQLAPFLGKILKINPTASHHNRSPRTYKVHRLNKPLPVNADWEKWKDIPAGELSFYMGERPFHQPLTKFKMAYNSENMYVIFRVEDRYLRTVHRGYHQPVYEDSCVEFFFTPGSDITDGYFNIEMNCLGAMLICHQKSRGIEMRQLSKEHLRQISVAASLSSESIPQDQEPVTWTLEYRIPMDILTQYTSFQPPATGIRWKANFYKCGDKTPHPHWLTWSHIDKPRPDFHRPEYFGDLIFQ